MFSFFLPGPQPSDALRDEERHVLPLLYLLSTPLDRKEHVSQLYPMCARVISLEAFAVYNARTRFVVLLL